MKYFYKVLNIVRQHGFITGTRIIRNLVLNRLKKQPIINLHKNDVVDFYKFINFPQNPPNITNPLSLDYEKVAWFIPDIGIGSGGHLNIFRMIYNLERLNVRSDLIICGNSLWGTPEQIKDIISKHFISLNSNVYIVTDEKDIDNLKGYDIAMATSWQTAYYVNNFSKCIKKAYFVQDYEPYFYAKGSNYTFSEQTYKFNFFGITAGSWLSKKLAKEYNMNCINFSFSYDHDIYVRSPKRDNIKRIFFYARPPTERRAFELGLLILNKVWKLYPDIHVVFAGWDISHYSIPYTHLNAGVVKLEELSDLYSQCDVALVLSLTNLSLLPLELAASGCPVVINDDENNTWLDPNKELFFYAKSDIDSMASMLIDVLDGKISLNQNKIDLFLKNTSWLNEAKTVKKALINLVRN